MRSTKLAFPLLALLTAALLLCLAGCSDDAVRDKAFKQGYNKGYKDGLEKGKLQEGIERGGGKLIETLRHNVETLHPKRFPRHPGYDRGKPEHRRGPGRF